MIVLSGASASGKTEVAKLLAKDHGITKIITTTTRPMRNGEVNGRDYFFVTKEEFEKLIAEGHFVEYTIYNGNYYGSGKDQVADDKCVVIDGSGLKAYTEIKDKFVVTFLLTCSEKVRYQRMLNRGDSVESAKARIKNDKTAFDQSRLVKADYVIDSEQGNEKEIAEIVFNAYKRELKSHYSNK